MCVVMKTNKYLQIAINYVRYYEGVPWGRGNQFKIHNIYACIADILKCIKNRH